MPTNVSVQYRTADAKYRTAKTIEDRRTALQDMLSTIPKHKGTEKMQADIKRRLARLRQESERRQSPKTHAVHVELEGAAQVVLLGPPNSGKSSLLAALTHARPTIAEYPFSTSMPQPGMMQFEDVQIQLVDLPPITSEHMDPWMPSVLQGADAALLLADASTAGTLEGIETIRDRLESAHLPLVGELPENAEPHIMPLPIILVLAKVDVVPEADLQVLEELYGDEFSIVRFSGPSRVGHQRLKLELWKLLQLVRVHNKPPGKKAGRGDPIVLNSGSTVLDLAERIHGDVAARLAYAKVWGGKMDGQKVSRDFELRDRDTVELGT